MKKSLGIARKIGFIGAIVFVLLIANLFIGLKLEDREGAKNTAVSNISSAGGGSFSLSDVCIVVPYVQHKKINGSYQDYKNGQSTIHARILDYSADVKTEDRKLGIYSSKIFTGEIQISGEFLCNLRNNSEYTYDFAGAKFFVGLNDRSIIEAPEFVVNDIKYRTSLNVTGGADQNFTDKHNGIVSDMKYREGVNTFSTVLKIRGAEQFRVMVNSDQAKLSVVSDCTTPGFSDFDYLPKTRKLTDKGFTAEWFVPFGSTGSQNDLGFRIHQGVDVYTMVYRAVTYGFLFIVVPFIVLFLFEVFMKVNLHPVNYLLCGAASIIFFLLLLSFSEHIPFFAAYLISAFASGLLTSFYVGSITGIPKTGFEMMGVFLFMYGYLYCSLKSEDYALLIGSIFAFVLIAILMIFTRKVDWNVLHESALDSGAKSGRKAINLNTTTETE